MSARRWEVAPEGGIDCRSVSAPLPSRHRARWFAAAVLVVLAVLVVGAVLYVRGALPASVPVAAGPFSSTDYARALDHVRPSGDLDFVGLGRDRAALERFVASLASVSPRLRPELFPTPEDSLAYWINAYNALVLLQLVERHPEGVSSAWFGRFYWGHAWPVGGERLTLWALEQRILGEYGDPRVHFALFRGTRGGPSLDGAPYQPEFLDAQLNDASRRFMASPRHVRLEGDTVHLARLFQTRKQDFLAALPEGRGGNVLQFVWAFLPDTCEERPGCDTRGDLDRACGPKLDTCRVTFMPEDLSRPDVADAASRR
ncbi:DUF547 domain-containing protein [Corallococcus praedator]|uniref:DUF547 domain-containing protein n=1 Tax=Corallococcus praedator TaxID=2316724 RepID=A0ABX9Q8P9_9BACT|nr:DUF547 domain-containing protein [Corallococcus sp. CA031C]RKH91877.1 DUF547 domain-containing protein [Corallococcus praedator]